MDGGAGSDRIDGGAGIDRCKGGKGRNRIVRCEKKKKAAPSNAAPVAAPDLAATSEDAPVAISVLANDSDADGDALTLKSLTPGTATASLLMVDGKVAYDPRGKLDALRAGKSLIETFTYTVADAKGATDTEAVTVTVTGVDDLPVAVADAVAVVGDHHRAGHRRRHRPHARALAEPPPRTNGPFTVSSASTATGGFVNTVGSAACPTN